MKKIGFCIKEISIGGAERVLLDLIKYLNHNNEYDIHLLTRYKSKENYLTKEIYKRVSLHYLKIRSKNNLILKIYNSIRKKIVLISFRRKIDLIIDFSSADFYKSIKNFNMKKIVYLHCSYTFLKKYSLNYKYLDHYDLVIACGEGIFKEIQEDKLLKKFDYINNLIDYKNINNKLNNKLNIQEEIISSKFFLTVCRLNENEKRCINFIESIFKI